jgi:hypothetical protein
VRNEKKIEGARRAVRPFLLRFGRAKAFNREGRKGTREGREEGPAIVAGSFPFVADRKVKRKS